MSYLEFPITKEKLRAFMRANEEQEKEEITMIVKELIRSLDLEELLRKIEVTVEENWDLRVWHIPLLTIKNDFLDNFPKKYTNRILNGIKENETIRDMFPGGLLDMNVDILNHNTQFTMRIFA